MNILSNSVFGSRRSGGLLLIVGVLGGVTVGGGVGVFAATSKKTVTVCADKKTNVLRYAKNGKCAKTETKVVLNKTGVAGAKGDTGAAGASGALTNSQTKNICGVNGATACAVGLQGPGGGIVFMTPSTAGNTSGLFYEAAPSTWSSPSGGTQRRRGVITQLGCLVFFLPWLVRARWMVRTKPL